MRISNTLTFLLAWGLAMGLAFGLAAPLAAQDDVPEVDNICDDGLMDGNSANVSAIAQIVQGSWSQIAAGEQFATGVDQNLAMLEYDSLTGGLFVTGESGRMELKPIRSATIASGMSRDRVRDAEVRWSRTGMEDGMVVEEEIDTTGDKLLELYGCDLANAPMFWWERTVQGQGRAAGFLVFITQNTALGYMEFTDVNTRAVRGSRSVYMYRN